jgi:proline iminopeptidase
MAQFLRLLFRGSFHDKRYADSLTLDFDSTYAAKSVMQRRLYKDSSLRTYDLHAKLDTIQCPTLILAGADDRFAPGTYERIHDHIKNSEYVLLPDCGHFPYIEAPSIFFPIIRRFLKHAAH